MVRKKKMSQMTPSAQQPVPYGGTSNAKYCQKCGAANDPNAPYCANCGASNFGAYPGGRISRPVGVTILAILQILGSLVTIIAGLTFGALFGALLPGLGAVLGLGLVALGVVTLLIAIALFTGRNWARILNIILAVIDLINFPVGTIIGIIFIIYFTRPRVVAYFKQPRTA